MALRQEIKDRLAHVAQTSPLIVFALISAFEFFKQPEPGMKLIAAGCTALNLGVAYFVNKYKISSQPVDNI